MFCQGPYFSRAMLLSVDYRTTAGPTQTCHGPWLTVPSWPRLLSYTVGQDCSQASVLAAALILPVLRYLGWICSVCMRATMHKCTATRRCGTHHADPHVGSLSREWWTKADVCLGWYWELSWNWNSCRSILSVALWPHPFGIRFWDFFSTLRK